MILSCLLMIYFQIVFKFLWRDDKFMFYVCFISLPNQEFQIFIPKPGLNSRTPGCARPGTAICPSPNWILLILAARWMKLLHSITLMRSNRSSLQWITWGYHLLHTCIHPGSHHLDADIEAWLAPVTVHTCLMVQVHMVRSRRMMKNNQFYTLFMTVGDKCNAVRAASLIKLSMFQCLPSSERAARPSHGGCQPSIRNNYSNKRNKPHYRGHFNYRPHYPDSV